MIRFAVTSLREYTRRGCTGRPAGRHGSGAAAACGVPTSSSTGKESASPLRIQKSCFGLCQSSGTFLSELPPPIANSKSSRKGKLVGERLRQLSGEPRALRAKLVFLALKSGVEGRGVGSEVV